MSDSVGDLIDQKIEDQLSEDEMAVLLDQGMEAYEQAKAGGGTAPIQESTLTLITPLQFWFT